jgi:large subunit ribosomal protein L10
VDRTEKEDLVASLHRTFSETTVVVVTPYIGLTVAEMGELRAQMREAGASIKVTKNRLVRLALDGTRYKELEGLFTGPTALAYSDDPVAAARVAVNFAKTNKKLVVLGGGLGEKVLGEEDVKSLAALPSLDELRAKLVGLVNAPATKVAGVLQAPAGQLARVLAARAGQDEAA